MGLKSQEDRQEMHWNTQQTVRDELKYIGIIIFFFANILLWKVIFLLILFKFQQDKKTSEPRQMAPRETNWHTFKDFFFSSLDILLREVLNVTHSF